MTRKHVLVAYAVGVVLATVYLPWTHHVVPQGFQATGVWLYAVPWDPKLAEDMEVNYGLVMLELIALTVTAGVAYRLAPPDTPAPPKG